MLAEICMYDTSSSPEDDIQTIAWVCAELKRHNMLQ